MSTFYPSFTGLFLPTTLTNASSYWSMPSDGRLLYTGQDTFDFIVTSLINFTGTNRIVYFRIMKNGIAVTGGTFVVKTYAAANMQIVNLTKIVSLANNDYIEIYWAIDGATADDIKFYGFNIVADL